MNKLYKVSSTLLALTITFGVCAKNYVLFNQTDEPISYEWYGYGGTMMSKHSEDRKGSLNAGEHILFTDVKPWSNAGYDYFRSEGTGDHINDFAFIIKDQSGNVVFKGAPDLDQSKPNVGDVYLTQSTSEAAKPRHRNAPFPDSAQLGYGVYWSPDEKENILTQHKYGLVVRKIKNGSPFLDGGNWDRNARTEIQAKVRDIGKDYRNAMNQATPLRNPTNVEVAAVYPENAGVGGIRRAVKNYYDYKKNHAIVLEGVLE